MKDFIEFLLWLHQLPQTTLGYILRLFYKGTDKLYHSGKCDVIVRRSAKMGGGISLGQFVIISQWSRTNTVKHELGHCIQSQYLGWLYLIVIGLPSIVWAMLYSIPSIYKKWSYYDFYTERWADKLGEVVRK